MNSLLKDVRYALRQLAKAPLLTALAALSFGLGVGANTTLYTWAKALLFDPYPAARDTGRLVTVHPFDPGFGETSVSYPDYRDLRDRSTTLSGLIASRPIALSIGARDQPVRVFAETVTGNYFDVLGVKIAHGRGFLPSEDEVPLRDSVIVLAHDFWERSFGADPSVIGRTVTVNARPFTVVGVADEGFYGTRPGLAHQAWVPLMVQEWVEPGGAGRLEERGSNWLSVLGRLRPGVSVEEAQAEIISIMKAVDAEHSANAVPGATVKVSPLWRAPQSPAAVLGPVFAVLAGLGILVLAIASANVACLLIARALSRQREIAVRTALGASRARVIRQLVVESLVLSALGAVCGVATAYAGAGLLEAMIPSTDFPMRLGARVETTALFVAFGLSALCGLAFGLLPAFQAARTDTSVALRESGTAVAGGRATARWFRRLVVAQVAAATVLLVAAGLFLRSAENARDLPLGFDPKGVSLTSMEIFTAGYDRDRGLAFWDRLRTEAASIPGARSVALARRIPLGFGGSSSTSVNVPGFTPTQGRPPFGFFNVVTPGYFKAMSLPLVSGREFEATDVRGAQAVAIVNETMASMYYSGRDPVGATFRIGPDELRIVGVAKNSLYRDIGERPSPWFYLPLGQWYRPDMTLMIRTDGDPDALATPARALLRSLDPGLAIVGQRSLQEHVRAAAIRQTLGSRMLGVMGALGLILATVGLFGTLAFGVAQRAKELSVRVALGGRREDILGLVFGDARRVMTIGLALGMTLGLGAAFAMRGLLIGVPPWDPAVFGAVLAALATTAVVAAIVPAWRAASVDPVTALRAD